MDEQTQEKLRKRSLHANAEAAELGVVLRKHVKTAAAGAGKTAGGQPFGTGAKTTAGTYSGNAPKAAAGAASAGVKKAAAGASSAGTAKTAGAASAGTGRPAAGPSSGNGQPPKKKGSCLAVLIVFIGICAVIAFAGEGLAGLKDRLSSDKIERQPVLYNYYDGWTEAADEVGGVKKELNYAQIGIQTAYFGQDLYIASFEDTGDLVGEEPHIVTVGWQPEWQDVYDIDWALGSLSFGVQDDRGYWVYEYGFDNVYCSAKEQYQNEYVSKGVKKGRSKKTEINGHTYLKYTLKEEDSAKVVFLEDFDGYGTLHCSVERLVNDGEEEELDAFLDDTAHQENCVRALRYDGPVITAASPLAGKTIGSVSGDARAVVSRDLAYEAGLAETYPYHRTVTQKTFWYENSIYFSRSYSTDAAGSGAAQESVRYSFETAQYTDPDQKSQQPEQSKDYVSDLQVGDVQTFTVNGRDVKARLLTYDVMSGNEGRPCQLLYVWLDASEETILMITDRIDNAKEDIDVEAAVQRLAGDSLQM